MITKQTLPNFKDDVIVQKIKGHLYMHIIFLPTLQYFKIFKIRIVSILECNPGFWGTDCSSACNCGRGMDFCNSKTGCVCKTGWKGKHCDVNINECLINPCSRGQTCTDLPGSFRCNCKIGFHLDGKSCAGECGKLRKYWYIIICIRLLCK